jgi:predicted secreted hydrolase
MILMRRTTWIIAGVVVTALWILVSAAVPPAAAEDKWLTAQGSRTWSFPEDHGAHGDYRTEWWYFTGTLSSPSGDFTGGYQLTFFRTGLKEDPAIPENPWSVRDLYLAHFTLTEVPGGKFHWTERVSRTGPGLAGAKDGDLEVWLNDWKAVRTGGDIHLQARSGEMTLDLTLIPRKPPVLHGKNGLSVKGPGPGQASWYYSMTGLDTKGDIRLPEGKVFKVQGKSWFDHEFGSNQLAVDQAGWDWFGLHLSNGTEVMIYMLRKTDGSLEPASSGTLIGVDGSPVHLALEDFRIQPVGSWKSPASGGTYPSGWRIGIPGEDIEITVTPVLRDQELVTRATAGITYWEGAVTLRGRAGGDEITGGGYVELTGYAGELGGIF